MCFLSDDRAASRCKTACEVWSHAAPDPPAKDCIHKLKMKLTSIQKQQCYNSTVQFPIEAHDLIGAHPSGEAGAIFQAWQVFCSS